MAVIVWFRPSCISCIFILFIFLLFVFFGTYNFLSVVLLFYGGQFNGLLWPFGNREINMTLMMMMMMMMSIDVIFSA